jgi:hypothetical protein
MKPEENAHNDPAQNPVEETQSKRTPMYAAIHAMRYERQNIIRNVESTFGHSLICYVSGNAAEIDSDDTIGIAEILQNCKRDQDTDLLLHTRGGDIDSAEKLISMVRMKVGSGLLRMIVPDSAKSAGTLMALGTDAIAMSDSSELGPIDPQITLDDGHGNLIPHSVQNYLDAYEEHSEALMKDASDVVARIMMSKLDPGTVKAFEAARNRARTVAERLLRRWMFRVTPGNYTAIAGKLINTNLWPSHGQVINWEEARDIGLTVQYMPPEDEQWQQYWRLYCLQRLAIKDREKLFESSSVSFQLEGYG